MVILFLPWCSLHFIAVSWCQITMGEAGTLDWRSKKNWVSTLSTKGSWMGEDYSWHSNYECTTLGWVLLKGRWLISLILLRKVTVFPCPYNFYFQFLLKLIWQKFIFLPVYVRTSKLRLSQNNLKRTCTYFWGFHVIHEAGRCFCI